MTRVGTNRVGLGIPTEYFLLATLLAIAWGGLVFKLTTDWSTNPQYEFGFFVPLFIGYLLVRRWGDRPDPSRSIPRSLLVMIGAIPVGLLLPIRIVQEANPDWRPFNWVHAVNVVALSLVVIATLGGWSWVAHFSVPLLLIFFCLPWPLVMEQTMVKELTGAVTRVTVELLNWINIPALQRGNVIEIATGSVGVADACSGMRSLAGTLMASAFFGEYYRLSWSRRIVLIIGGTAVAFGLNLCRTFFLGWRTAAEGPQALAAWHDPAGYIIFLISFATLWLFAKAALSETRQTVKNHLPGYPVAGIGAGTLVAATVWLLGTYAVTEFWYRFREGTRIPVAAWSIRWPDESSDFRFCRVPEEVRSILRYSEGTSAIMEWPDGKNWQIFMLEWEAGRSSAQLATMHRPEICMPAAGFKLISTARAVDVSSPNVVLTLDGSIFDCNGLLVYVYRCLWEDQSASGVARGRRFDMSVSGRLMSSWYGRRNLGQKLLQIGVSGARSEQEAREDLRRRLPDFIVAGA